ncbi:hypothetical protein OK016_12040 [Vibrio chagasii]|nr:hypothetical protein [Vibrio chagasii]
MKSQLSLDVGGVYQWKQRGEKHLFNPETISTSKSRRVIKITLSSSGIVKAVDDQGDNAATLRS